MLKLSPAIRGYSMATLASFAAALFFIPYKKGLETMSANEFLLAVYIVGFFLNLGGSGLRFNRVKVSSSTWMGAIGFTFLSVLGNYSIGKSLEGIEPSLTVVMVRSQIIIVIFLGWWLLKEKLNPFLLPGSVIAMGGLAWMNIQGENHLSGNMIFFLWGFSAAFFFGITQIFIKKIVHSINPIQLNHIRLLMGAIIFASIPGTLSRLFELNSTEWLLAATSAAFGPSLSRLLQIYALRYIPVTQSILFTMLTPVFALLLSAIFLGTIPSSREIEAGAIILFGISIPVFYLIKSRGGGAIS